MGSLLPYVQRLIAILVCVSCVGAGVQERSDDLRIPHLHQCVEEGTFVASREHVHTGAPGTGAARGLRVVTINGLEESLLKRAQVAHECQRLIAALLAYWLSARPYTWCP